MKNENAENLAAICGGGTNERCVGIRNGRAARGRTIENEGRAGVLRRKEKECGFEEGNSKIRFACRSLAWNNAHEQG